jgi:hypothetical protein
VAAAWFALFGVLAGVVVTFLGNALLQNEQRTAVRRDAAVDREAANLRDLQEAVTEFARVWGPIMTTVIQGGPPFDPMDPANADGRPGETFGRVDYLAHRAQVQGIRDQAHDWIGREFLFVRTGNLVQIVNIAQERLALDTAIAVRIRELETPPPTLLARVAAWSRSVGLIT